MRLDVENDTIILAVASCIHETFDEGMWRELGLRVRMQERIVSYPRLLQGAKWKNPDYRGLVFEIVPIILEGPDDQRQATFPSANGHSASTSFPNLAVIEQFIDLHSWLNINNPELSQLLYGGNSIDVLNGVEADASRFELKDVSAHVTRIRAGLRDDPAQAVGASKDMLETVFKAILGLHGNGRETLVDLPQLVKRTNILLGLDAAGVRSGEPGAEQRRRLLGSLSMIVGATADLRNSGFGTGHGGSQRLELDIATANLVVSSAATLASFYLEAARPFRL